MRTRRLIQVGSMGLLLLSPLSLPRGPATVYGHVNSPFLLEECGSCHVGHGTSGEPMLALAEEDFCYQCHGSSDERGRLVAEGRLAASAQLGDIEREFEKPFRHPVVEGTGHSPVEMLPSSTGGSASHAECVDCHDPHQRVEAGPPQTREVTGYSLSGRYLETSLHEYEVCLKCHADQNGVDRLDRSLLADFSLTARSQHPVTRAPSGRRLPSLDEWRSRGVMMTCSDCHSSDDPTGPRGPHGSTNRFLLTGNYSLDAQGDESAYAYEFCYSCHDRFSLLSNDSFPLHREHIVGDPITGQRGTSCFTCHASHGSEDQPHLIRFNLQAVSGEETTRLIQYRELGERSGECWLECHGYNHAPGSY